MKKALIALSLSLFIAIPAIAEHELTPLDRGGDRLSRSVDLIQGMLDRLNDANSEREFVNTKHELDSELEQLLSQVRSLRQNLQNSNREFISEYTTEPIRGGSDRRTRTIDNPFPYRIVTGITFTGLDRDFVHIRDLYAFPNRRRLDRGGYELSTRKPPAYIAIQPRQIDHITVAAKKRSYFTTTFHYD